MAYCMYLRKSRADLEAEARGEGETLARHLRTLQLLADRMGITVEPSAIYREIVSGDTIAARPMMQRLLQEVQDGLWEGVLCTEVERLARGDTIDQGLVAQAFKYSGTRIITPAKVYDPSNDMDEEYFEFSLFMARREYKAIKRRMQAGRAASVREGHYVGGKRPFGYQVVKAPGKGYTLQQIPEEAAVVRQVFSWYLSGIGCSQIANRLNTMGAATYSGKPWQSGTIRKMLTLPVYAGFVQWLKREAKTTIQNGQRSTTRPFSSRYILAKGLHEPIVSKQDFDQVAAILHMHDQSPKVEPGQITNPLAGLIKCGLCGYAMVRRPNASGVFYVCRNSVCNNSSAYQDLVVALVLNKLRATVAEYDAPLPDAPAPSQAPDHSQEIAIARSAIDTARKQLTTAQDMLERGVYTIDEYLNRKSILQEKINTAQAELERIRTQSQPDQAAAIRYNLPRIRQVLDAWPFATTPGQQNALLRSILSRVDYSKTHSCLRNESAADFISISLSFLPTHKSE